MWHDTGRIGSSNQLGTNRPTENSTALSFGRMGTVKGSTVQQAPAGPGLPSTPVQGSLAPFFPGSHPLPAKPQSLESFQAYEVDMPDEAENMIENTVFPKGSFTATGLSAPDDLMTVEPQHPPPLGKEQPGEPGKPSQAMSLAGTYDEGVRPVLMDLSEVNSSATAGEHAVRRLEVPDEPEAKRRLQAWSHDISVQYPLFSPITGVRFRREFESLVRDLSVFVGGAVSKGTFFELLKVHVNTASNREDAARKLRDDLPLWFGPEPTWPPEVKELVDRFESA